MVSLVTRRFPGGPKAFGLRARDGASLPGAGLPPSAGRMKVVTCWPCWLCPASGAAGRPQQPTTTLRLAMRFPSNEGRSRSPPACGAALSPGTGAREPAMASMYRGTADSWLGFTAGDGSWHIARHSIVRRRGDARSATAPLFNFRARALCVPVLEFCRTPLSSTDSARQIRYSSSDTSTGGTRWMESLPSENPSPCIQPATLQGPSSAGGRVHRFSRDRPPKVTALVPSESWRYSYSTRLQRDGAAYWALSKGRLSVWVALSTLAGYAGGLQAVPTSCDELSHYGLAALSAGSSNSGHRISCLSDPTSLFSSVSSLFSGNPTVEAGIQVAALFAGVFGSSAAANALNQLYERKIDSVMKRTRHR